MMYAYLNKKISIPNCSQLWCVSWMQTSGYIASSGTEGTLKLLKLSTSLVRGSTSTDLSVNQNMDGHSVQCDQRISEGCVHLVKWNEVYQKLSTCDNKGLIIVWSARRGTWYEEMINNRHKSTITDMSWSHNGVKIAIVFEDGHVIVGSVDGNRQWCKDIDQSIVAVCWSTDSSLLFFGMSDGEVRAYDSKGDFVRKVNMVCLENMEPETTPSRNLRRNLVVSMEWFVPVSATKVVEGQIADQAVASIQTYRGLVPENRPRFFVAYKRGVIQFMKDENDTNSIIVKLPNMVLTNAHWCPDGKLLAVCGSQTNSSTGKCAVQFITAYGEKCALLQVPGERIFDVSSEAGGLRICIAVDFNLYFATIRPNYIWAYCGHTVVYCYEKSDNIGDYIMFYETKLEETYIKYVDQLIAIAAYDEHCAIVSKLNDKPGIGSKCLVEVCNGIATPIDSKFINITPKYAAMNASYVLLANDSSFTISRYSIPCSSFRDAQTFKNHSNDEIVYSVDEAMTVDPHAKSLRLDSICAISIAEKFFLICRESGITQKYSLPQIVLQGAFNIGVYAKQIGLNSNGTRLAVLSLSGIKIFNIIQNKVEAAYFERQDVWNFMWDMDKDDTIVVIEKTRLYVVRNNETEEPTVSSGFIGLFRHLVVRTVLLDEIMKNPETPEKSCIVDVEMKTLREAKNLLAKMKLQEAAVYIEEKNHPKLWNLLAEVALDQLNLSAAEHAFVMMKDYCGIQFVKRIAVIPNDEFKRAEIALFFGKLSEAEEIYLKNDRKDLAIAAHRKLNNWIRIAELVEECTEPGEGELLKQAWKHIGDHYAEKQDWLKAAEYYANCENHVELVRCYAMADDYDKLFSLSSMLSDGDNLLATIGEMMGSAGLCDKAVDCYVRCNMLNEAVDICVQLNKWDTVLQVARAHNLSNVDGLLSKYAEQFAGSSERTLAAAQLYRRAGQFIDAAKIIFTIASNERMKQAQPLRLKKLYVLGALLIEQHRDKKKANLIQKSTSSTNAEISLKGLLEEDQAISLEDANIIDNTWRGADAYHYYMLAQRQLHNGDEEAVTKTALYLTNFDDFIDPVEIYSLLALVSCMSRQFAICSRAFIKLESLENVSPTEHEAFKDLALRIFTKHPPINTNETKMRCIGCSELIPDYCFVCPLCDTQFPASCVTGRPLIDHKFWICPTCKHQASENEIVGKNFCPLCHDMLVL